MFLSVSLLFEVLRNTFTTWHAILCVKASYSCREVLFPFPPDLHDSNVSTRFYVSSTFLEHLSYFATIILPLLARYSNRRLRPESRERDTRRENVKKLVEEWWKERDDEVRTKNPNSSRFFFLLGPVSRCKTRRGEERGGGQEKRQDTRFPSRRVNARGKSLCPGTGRRAYQEADTHRSTNRCAPSAMHQGDRQTFLAIIFVGWKRKGKSRTHDAEVEIRDR